MYIKSFLLNRKDYVRSFMLCKKHLLTWFRKENIANVNPVLLKDKSLG